MKQEGQPSSDGAPSGSDPARAGGASPDHVVAAAADAQTAKPQPTEPATEPRPVGPSPAPAVAAPERVDWTAILEERALVPDSEAASPIAEAVVLPGEHGRRRGLLYLIVALTALFSLVASAAVVVALMRDDKAAPASAEREEEAVARPPPQEPPPAPPSEPVAGAVAAGGVSDPEDGAAAAASGAEEEADAEEKSRAADQKRERERQTRTDRAEKSGKPETDRSRKGDKEPASEGGKRGKGEDGKAEGGKRGDEKGEDGKAEDGKGADGKGDDGARAVASDGSRPDKPSVKDLAAAMKPLEAQIHACAKENGVTGTAAIKLEVGADGKVAWAAVREGGGAFQGCVNKVVRAIRLPASENGGTLIHSVSLPDP